jgi:NAD(P)H-nitrite reductase large subunit
MQHIVIIGNGISGITAARHIRKQCDSQITVISSETEHFFSRTALMYIYMGHMTYAHTKPYEDFFWKKNRIDLVFNHVEKVHFGQRSLELKGGEILGYDKLILAVGSTPNMFGWPGQDLKGVQGMYSYQDLELLEKNTHPPLISEAKKKVKIAVIVGGGLIGVELAEMLHTRGIHCVFLIRESKFWGNVLPEEEGSLVSRHLIKYGIDLRFETELAEIISDENGRAKGVKTSTGEIIDCQLVGLTAGVRANVDWLKGGELEIDRGILVDSYLQTNLEDVYAIGDCVQLRKPLPGRRPIEQVWYSGRMMGEVVASTLSGKPRKYEPGNWFNSAKFFDIEYQTYGSVNAVPLENEKSFYWEDSTGEKCLKLVFDQKSETLIGVNVFGIRLRHELLDQWLNENRSVDYVLSHMADANFDTEFYRRYETEIVKSFNKEFSKNLSLQKASWKRIFAKAKQA